MRKLRAWNFFKLIVVSEMERPCTSVVVPNKQIERDINLRSSTRPTSKFIRYDAQIEEWKRRDVAAAKQRSRYERQMP
ncbi:hypothetical protein GJ496_003513 [Pomphorhynchus laevis]|nr:hypothetical protein GJ496_003513 [Pomphorhynchus laevis]